MMSEVWRGGEEVGEHSETKPSPVHSIAEYHQITFPNDKLNYNFSFFMKQKLIT